MNIAQIEKGLQKVIKSFKKTTFIYDFLLAYGQPKASITRLQKGSLNLSKIPGEILWKKKIFFKVDTENDLHEVIDELRTYEQIKKHDPRFIIVTDFETFLATDRKTLGTLDIPLPELARHFDFFLPLAGMEKAQHQKENPADVKAAERMAKLYDEIRKDNPTKTPEGIHSLNVFLSRLLFCFFAEDTGIFEKDQFTHAIINHTQQDGSDLNTYLDKLFEVMNTEGSKRKKMAAYLEAFPYVNGGLFKDKHRAPIFSKRSRQGLIDSGTLDWSEINPDIFGSMMQGVVSPEHRGTIGMHYTSVPNIMKVIEPLFLNELYVQFEAAKGSIKKLGTLLNRIWNMKVFDPACGSGNFLVIAYKELRKLEMKIFKELNTFKFSGISLRNFYGIEIDDFAHEIAILSLWLAEHQMNQIFLKEFGRTKPALPLKESGNIFHGNATTLPWEKICPKQPDEEIYIFGNPPYLGSALQSTAQKENMAFVFREFDEYKKLDFISCWFYLACRYIKNAKAKFAFVSTNSICQGEQVSILWPNILRMNLEIDFAHQSFPWKNNAKSNAAVAVVIIGIRNRNESIKRLYSLHKYILVKNINPYLVATNNIFVTSRNSPLSNLPNMIQGCSPNDDGNLLFSEIEKDNLCKKFPQIRHLFKNYLGADEFMNSGRRYCLWMSAIDKKLAYSIPELRIRIEKCKTFRLASKKEATRRKAATPYEFDEKRYEEADAIVIPKTGSERREYVPIGFLRAGIVVSNATRIIYGAEPYVFAIISSRLHLVWVKAVAGRLKTDMQYSISLCYNTFPLPDISNSQKKELEKNVYRLLEAREQHSERTLAQLYDPDKMPTQLKEAHFQLDLAVERCYRSKLFASDEERLEYLFKLYEQMIAQEKAKGTLFAITEKPSKKKK